MSWSLGPLRKEISLPVIEYVWEKENWLKTGTTEEIGPKELKLIRKLLYVNYRILIKQNNSSKRLVTDIQGIWGTISKSFNIR